MDKEKIEQVISTLPKEVDVDALIEKLHLLDKIEIAEKELARGQGVPHDEARQRLRPWLE